MNREENVVLGGVVVTPVVTELLTLWGTLDEAARTDVLAVVRGLAGARRLRDSVGG